MSTLRPTFRSALNSFVPHPRTRHNPVSYLPRRVSRGFLPHSMTDDLEIAPALDDTPRYLAPGEVGLVTPHDFIYNQPFTFKSGQVIPGFTLRYETYGTLSATRSNVILVCHALSGDHHCAGWHKPADKKPGGLNNLIGPGKAVDTRRFFVICANVLGGCQGSTGPSSMNPETGRPYGTLFPFVTIRD